MTEKRAAVLVEASAFPDVGEFVVATVIRLEDYGAYVRLDEYVGKEGLIHISEIATTWVKNIRNFLRVGQKLVLKVQRVNREKNQVDLSLRKVTGREKSDKMMEWKKGRTAEAILKTVSEKLHAPDEASGQVVDGLLKEHDSLYEALEDGIEEGPEFFTKLGLTEEWANGLVEVARGKIKLEKARVRATLQMVCYGKEGIEGVRAALLSAKKIRRKRGSEIRIYSIGSPRYRIELTAQDYPTAEEVLKNVVKEALATIEKFDGEGKVL